LVRLERKITDEGIILTEAQVQALEKNGMTILPAVKSRPPISAIIKSNNQRK
jgi:hypothetical protein